jgi:hypothetical protein
LKLINDKGRIFGIINPIDILAVIIVAAVCVFLAWFLLDNENKGFDRYVYYTIEVVRVDEAFDLYDTINVGDELRCNIFLVDIGTVYSVRFEPHRELVFIREEDNPRFEEREIPNLEKMFLTVKSPAFDNGRALEIMSLGYEVRMGGGMNFRGKGYQGNGFIVELRQVMMDNG